MRVTTLQVEQCGNGAAYCQIFDVIHPGEIPVKRLLFDAKLEHDCIKNYKVLQQIFEKKKISKNIEVEKLLKGKPLDNLEMLQVCGFVIVRVWCGVCANACVCIFM